MTDPDFATRLRVGEPLVGAWSVIGDPVVAEVLATKAFDFVVLDGEHSENTIADLAAGVRAIEAADGDTAPVVRVSGLDRAEIRRVLDLGPQGVVVPQIESVDDAREAVAAAVYPPDGVRGVAGGRASGYGANIESYVAGANDDIATILQIETEGAVRDIDAIVELDGLDALFIGPADLSARLGVFGEFDRPAFREAIETVGQAASEGEIPLGTLATDPGNVGSRWHDWGMDFLVTGTDVGFLQEGAGTYLDRFESIR